MIHPGAIHAELEQARSEAIAPADLLDHVPMSGEKNLKRLLPGYAW
jgi:hypothetical protein